MKKKLTFLLLVFFILFDSKAAQAAITSEFISNHGFSSNRDGYTLVWSSQISRVHAIRWTNNTTGLSRVDTEDTGYDGVWIRCNCNFSWDYLDRTGNVMATDSVTVTQVSSPSTSGVCGSGDGDGNDGGGSGNEGGGGNSGGSDCGCIFRTPGWEQYMGKIDELIGKIPPPPNWQQVANTFRDTIAPRIQNDMRELLGRAPSLPNQPNPARGVDDRNLRPPTGDIDRALEGFDPNDIKREAPNIEERDDPTDGWNILNPIDTLPSQDEFKDNIPEEQDTTFPEVPDVDAEAPGAPEEDYQTPGEPEEDYQMPGAPKQEENPVPGAPKEQDNPTPSDPKEQDNPTPGAPKDDSNPAPTPGEQENNAPTPNEPSNPFPTPGSGSNQAPVPGRDNSTAPIPSRDNSRAPTPGADNTGVPIPNGRR